LDGNGDGYTWQCGTTGDLGSYEPPDYGSAYFFYSDEDAGYGSYTPYETMISPSIDVSGYPIVKVIYSYGVNLVEGSQMSVEISCGDTLVTKTYTGQVNGWDTVYITQPGNSLTIEVNYTEEMGIWSFACGIDNITVLGGNPPQVDVGVETAYGYCQPAVSIVALVRNFGQTYVENIGVSCSIEPFGWYDQTTIAGLSPGEVAEVLFVATDLPEGDWTVTVCTLLDDDCPDDDCLTFELLCSPDYKCTWDGYFHRKFGTVPIYSVVRGRFSDTLTEWLDCLYIEEIAPDRWDTSICIQGPPLAPGDSAIIDFGWLNFGVTYYTGKYIIIDTIFPRDLSPYPGGVLEQQLIFPSDSSYNAWLSYNDIFPGATDFVGNLYETYAVAYFPKDLGGRIDSVEFYCGPLTPGATESFSVMIYGYNETEGTPGGLLFDTTVTFNSDTFIKIPVPSIEFGGYPFYVAIKFLSTNEYIGIETMPPLSMEAGPCMLITHWKREPEWIWEPVDIADLILWAFIRGWECGDVNGDGEVTASDAILILLWISGSGEIASSRWNANVNGDGSVTPADALEILYWLSGLFALNCQPVTGM